MSENTQAIESLTQSIAELQETVRGRAADATLDWDSIAETFETQIDELVERRVRSAMERQPVRRIPGAYIRADGTETPFAELKGNRYVKTLHDFADHGKSRTFGADMKPIDLWLAHFMMSEQFRLKHSRISGQANPPSDDLEAAVKAMTSTGAGTGDELVPTDLADQLWDDIFLASKVVGSGNAGMIVIPMPTNPFDIPLGLGQPTWRKGTENTATTASDLSTAKSVLTATELITEQNWSYTLDEDAIVAMAPQIRARLAQSGAEIIDDFAINADATNAATGNINLDDADPADDSYYLSDGQDGIRHQWLVDNTGQEVNAGGDALVDADVTGALSNMDKYAINPADVRIVCGAQEYIKGFMSLTDTVTVDKFGPNAVIHTGQLAAYRGIPVIVSASHRLAEADGKLSTTPANNTLGSISFFNRQMWYAGFRRQILIEIDRDIQKRQFIMVTSLREAVAAHGTRSTNQHTAGIRNILV